MPDAVFPTPIGPCRLRWQDDRLTGFALPESNLIAATPVHPPPAWIAALITRVQTHLCGNCDDFSDQPYAFEQVSNFARDVYRCTLQIKAGCTCSYGDIARQLGLPVSASRAVGAALGANPWPLLVPCHRVLAADGRMSGFSGPGGITMKLRLIAIEGAQLFGP